MIDPLSGFIKHITTSNRSPAGLNWGGYQNPEIDRLAAEALATFDDAEQTKILQTMHEIYTKDAGRLFIVHDLNPRALSPKVKGFVQSQSYFLDLTRVSID